MYARTVHRIRHRDAESDTRASLSSLSPIHWLSQAVRGLCESNVSSKTNLASSYPPSRLSVRVHSVCLDDGLLPCLFVRSARFAPCFGDSLNCDAPKDSQTPLSSPLSIRAPPPPPHYNMVLVLVLVYKCKCKYLTEVGTGCSRHHPCQSLPPAPFWGYVPHMSWNFSPPTRPNFASAPLRWSADTVNNSWIDTGVPSTVRVNGDVSGLQHHGKPWNPDPASVSRKVPPKPLQAHPVPPLLGT